MNGSRSVAYASLSFRPTSDSSVALIMRLRVTGQYFVIGSERDHVLFPQLPAVAPKVVVSCRFLELDDEYDIPNITLCEVIRTIFLTI